MKKILFLFLAACFFFSCEKETIVIPQQHAGRTVLAFFWADNSLNSSLRNNYSDDDARTSGYEGFGCFIGILGW